MSMWGRCYGLGDDHDQRVRIRETTLNYGCSLPPLYIMIKDHKVIQPGKLPGVRTVVANHKAMGVHLSNSVSELVEAVADTFEGDFESISTEDAASRIDNYNSKIELNEDEIRYLMGADAISLFPSLDNMKAAQLVAEEFLNGSLIVEGADYQEIALYVALNWSPDTIRSRGLQEYAPTRRSKYGQRPGITGEGAMGQSKECKAVSM